MVLQRKLPVRLLDFVGGGVAIDAEELVELCIVHLSPGPHAGHAAHVFERKSSESKHGERAAIGLRGQERLLEEAWVGCVRALATVGLWNAIHI
jgi:hypothetical protein